MSVKKRNTLYYSRDDLTGMGSSNVQLFKLEEPEQISTIIVDGKQVRVKGISLRNLNPYILIEKYRNMNLTTVDVVYGNIDINTAKRNETEKEKLFDEILSRENVIAITRNSLGLMPKEIETDPYGNRRLKFDLDEVKALTREIFNSAYLEDRETSVKMNSDRKGGFFARLFGFSPQETTELSGSQDRVNYSRVEKVCFFKSGSVIFNNALFFKYVYATQDRESGISPKVSDFLIGEFDEEKLAQNAEYRKKFVSQVLVPSKLRNARTVPIFPYIGEFTDSGEFRFNSQVWGQFDKINSTEGR